MHGLQVKNKQTKKTTQKQPEPTLAMARLCMYHKATLKHAFREDTNSSNSQAESVSFIYSLERLKIYWQDAHGSFQRGPVNRLLLPFRV